MVVEELLGPGCLQVGDYQKVVPGSCGEGPEPVPKRSYRWRRGVEEP